AASAASSSCWPPTDERPCNRTLLKWTTSGTKPKPRSATSDERLGHLAEVAHTRGMDHVQYVHLGRQLVDPIEDRVREAPDWQPPHVFLVGLDAEAWEC